MTLVARSRFRFGGRVHRPGAVVTPEPKGSTLESYIRLGFIQVVTETEAEAGVEVEVEDEAVEVEESEAAQDEDESDETHICDTCGFEARSAGGLATHQRTHEDEE